MEDAWEFQLSAKKWVRYESAISKQLSDEVEKGSKTFETEIDGCNVSFDFEALKQKTVNTKFLKPIRCAILNHDKEYVLWEYQVSRRYVSFFPSTAIELEQLHEQTNVTSVTFKGAKATVSFDTKKMMYGDDEENETKIRRTISDAEPASSGQPVLAKDDQTSTRSTTKRKDDIIRPRDEEVENKKMKLDEALKTAKKSNELFADVDEYCPGGDSKKVFIEKNDVYSVMLNQTNIAQNNNKYFLCQLLESKVSSNSYYVFFRWGRVGLKGQNSLTPCGDDLEKAKKVFCNKFFDKTSNEFYSRKKFIKVKGKYDLIEMDYSKSEAPKIEEKPEIPEVAVESKLNQQVQDLLKLICDFKKMEEIAKGFDYDTRRAPLGKLTKAQIKAGYEALKKIEDCIILDNYGSDFRDAVDAYYTRIPHYFGMRPPKTIDTLDELKQELELLEFLSDIEAAVASLSIEVKNVETLHPLDKKYAQLKCDLEPLDKDHDRFKLVETYLLKTHTHAHNGYTMKLKNVYEIKKHGEDQKFKAEIGNRRLLWHGSRITNWHGILSSGLRIAPKEAPMTGYMFGKGVYFADASSKSANYCCARIGETGILVLSEVALGEMNQLTQACYNASKLPEGKFSTMGVGRFAPNHEQYITIDDDVVVPCGDMIEQDDGEKKDLMFNEYIVYDTNQIKLRYLVEVEFN
uniref:Poly [ADP-ribose] polymerase n=1 Tax=Panagrolaimus sp. PS1159 TaxID=55785 RepID=A0AC35FQG0_9BILA